MPQEKPTELSFPNEIDLSTPLDSMPSSDIDDDFTPSPQDRGDFLEEPSDDDASLDDDPPANEQEKEDEGTPPTDEEKEEPSPKEEDAKIPPKEIDDKEEPEKPKQPIMVPKSRLDEVSAKARAIEEENELLRRRILGLEPGEKPKEEKVPEPEYDFAAKQKEVYEAILDGDTDKANTIQAEIDSKREERIREQVQTTARNTMTEAQEAALFDRAVNHLQSRFTFFNPEAPDYDDALTRETVLLRDAYVQTHGISRAQALMKAAQMTMALHRPEDWKAWQEEQSGKPASKETPKEKPATPRQNSPRALEAERAQAPDLSGEGNKTGKTDLPDPTKLTEEEFDALPEATKKRLRGD